MTWQVDKRACYEAYLADKQMKKGQRRTLEQDVPANERFVISRIVPLDHWILFRTDVSDVWINFYV